MPTTTYTTYTSDQLRHIVRAAAGDCPISFGIFWDLESVPSDPVIVSWFWEVRNYGLRRDQFFTAEAIANWASTFFPMSTPEFDHIYSVIIEYADAISDHDGG